jgi:alpha-tubulin suppressor-like RCC1 family protein
MYHGAALMNDGSVVAWGNNDWGQATVPAALQRTGPTVDAAASVNASAAAVQIACGRNHTMALLSNRSVIGW